MPQTAYDLEPVLRAVARTTAASLGYGTAVINLYRPAWDDFHTVVVEGSDGARRLLLGPTSTADTTGSTCSTRGGSLPGCPRARLPHA